MDVRVVSAAEVGELEQSSVKGALREAFVGLTNGRSVQPIQTVTVLADGAGDAIFYPAALVDLGVLGVKVSPYLTGLSEAGKPPVTAYTLLLSIETGEPIVLCDSLALTTTRTAATTSLALDYLIGPAAERLLVVGSGRVAEEHLRFVMPQHEWKEVTVYSPSLAREGDPASGQRREALASRFGDLRFASSMSDAARGADVVMLCTSSGTPVIDDADVLSAQVVTSISTNVPRAHEISPSVLGSIDVYCDYRVTAPATAGEMLIAKEENGWDPAAIVADLPEMITEHLAPCGDRTAFFRSTGLGIEDLAIASLV